MAELTTMFLDGESLSPDTLFDLGRNTNYRVELTSEAWARVKAGRKVIDDILASRQVVYGINTGFGKFESTIIPSHQLNELQENLIRSHCAGVGLPLRPHRARMMLVLRINVLAKGHSGIRAESLHTLIDAYNKGVVPRVPIKGTVGASGDLAPLAHLAQGMIGEGLLSTIEQPDKWRPAAEVLQEKGIAPIKLEPKEGLAMINGTQFISAYGAEALVRARCLARVVDVIAAMSYEALMCTTANLHPSIHQVRPHLGQMNSATRLRSILHNERFFSQVNRLQKTLGRVQDAYSIRCAPQVHGVAEDIVRFVYKIMNTELNSATDNPLIFANAKDHRIISGGNFHGEYPAKAMDILAIGISELGNISERRIERLNNPSLSQLPAFLVAQGGLNSGFMIAHCTSAALCSENKTLCHPASVDSISTSAAQEDHVSMGGFAARKALKVVENTESILAIELLCACQGIDFRRPLKTTEPLEKVWSLVRSVCPPWTKDRDVSVDITKLVELIQKDQIWDCVSYAIPEHCWLSRDSMFLDPLAKSHPKNSKL